MGVAQMLLWALIIGWIWSIYHGWQIYYTSRPDYIEPAASTLLAADD